MDQGQAAGAASGIRIGVDGFNLAMPRGTGVATYGRVLTQALAGIGHPVDVLYGANIGPRTPALLREVMFFDSLDQEGTRKRPGMMTPRWIREALGDRRASTAVPVPITGRVLSEPFRARMPAYDRILNVGDLWGRAERHFRLWGSFMPVRIPDPPAVMHWTYPLPIRLEGARNVYTLHDLVPLRMPYTTLDNKRLYTRLIRGCLAIGDHVCTVSEASRRDIMDLFGVPPDRITNTWQSAIPAPAPVQTSAELAACCTACSGWSTADTSCSSARWSRRRTSGGCWRPTSHPASRRRWSSSAGAPGNRRARCGCCRGQAPVCRRRRGCGSSTICPAPG